MKSFFKIIWPIAVLIIGAFIFLLLIVNSADAHYKPGIHNAIHSINLAFCGRSNYSCRAGVEAVEVAECEAAQYWDFGRPWEARNGQYRGMFQMGKTERETYGHGPDPWKQARAAYRYYVSSGRDWSPWECKP